MTARTATLASGTLTLCSDAFWISPYVFSCFVALREKRARFEVKEIKLQAKEQEAAEYRAATWTGRVPALLEGAFSLTESSAILEYLEETLPPPEHGRLLPENTRARARARQLMSWLRSDETIPIRAERSSEVIFYERPLPALTPKATAAVEKLTRLVGQLVTSADAPLFGEWCIADAELAFFLHRLMKDEGVVPVMLRGYADAQWKRPSVAEWVAHPRAPFLPYG